MMCWNIFTGILPAEFIRIRFMTKIMTIIIFTRRHQWVKWDRREMWKAKECLGVRHRAAIANNCYVMNPSELVCVKVTQANRNDKLNGILHTHAFKWQRSRLDVQTGLIFYHQLYFLPRWLCKESDSFCSDDATPILNLVLYISCAYKFEQS